MVVCRRWLACANELPKEMFNLTYIYVHTLLNSNKSADCARNHSQTHTNTHVANWIEYASLRSRWRCATHSRLDYGRYIIIMYYDFTLISNHSIHSCAEWMHKEWWTVFCVLHTQMEWRVPSVCDTLASIFIMYRFRVQCAVYEPWTRTEN